MAHAGERRRGGWRAAGVLSVVALLLVGGAAALTQTAAFRSWLRARLVASLNARLDGTVAVGGLDGNLLSRMVLRDVRLRRAGARVLALERLEARYDLLALLLHGRLRIHTLAVDGLALTLVERDGRWSTAGLWRADGTADARSVPPAIEIERVTMRDAAIKVIRPEAAWHLRGVTLAGAAAATAGTQRLTVDALSFVLQDRGLRVQRLRGGVRLDAAGGAVVHGRVRTAGSRLGGHLQVRPGARPRYALALAAPRLAAADLGALLGAAAPAVDVAVRARAHGPASALALRARLASRAGDATLAGTLDGSADPLAYDLRAAVHHVDLARFFGPGRPPTDLDGTLQVAGSGVSRARARLTASAALAHVVVGDARLRQLTARASLADDALDVTARASAAAGYVDVHGALALDTERYEVHATAEDLDPAELTGRRDAAGWVRGTLDVQGTGLTRERARASVALALNVSDLRPLAALAGVAPLAGTLAVTGTAAGSPAHLDFDLRATGRDLAREDVRLDSFDLALAGQSDGEATRVTIDALRFQVGRDAWAVEGRPVVVQRGARVTTDGVVLASPHGRARIAGGAVLHGPIDLALAVDGIDLARLGAAAPADLAGRLSARAVLGGTAEAPSLDADLTLEDAAVGAVRYEGARARATIGGGQGRLTATITQAAERALVLDAALPVRFALTPFALEPGATLQGSLRAEAIDLAFLDPLIAPLSQVRGRLDADLVLGGSPTAPAARGTITLTGGRARVEALGITYDPVDAVLRVDGDRAAIERLEIHGGEGVLRGLGDVTLGGDGPTCDLRVELVAFPALANEHGEGAVSGWVWMTGTGAAPVIEGALAVDRLTLRLPEEITTTVAPLDPTITVVGPAAPSEPSGAEATVPGAGRSARPALYDRAAVTVQIGVPRNAWLTRSDAKIELEGWLTVWKKPADTARVAGEIGAARGWYTFRGKRFALAEGRVTFTGEDLDPLLDLTAVHKTRGYEVFVIVGGKLSKPTLRLESDPPLTESDVLSVLLFGKTAAELSGGEHTALREQTVAIAGSYAASGLTRSVASRLGLDTLQVESGGSGVEGPAITAGKYVTEDVFVSLSHRFGAERVDELRLEYDLTKEWSIETSSDTLGRNGVDVFWKRRY